MPTMAEMVEAHLTNVQREINTLQERKSQIDAEISKLEQYLKEGVETLKSSQTPVESVETVETPTTPPVFTSLGG